MTQSAAREVSDWNVAALSAAVSLSSKAWLACGQVGISGVGSWTTAVSHTASSKRPLGGAKTANNRTNRPQTRGGGSPACSVAHFARVFALSSPASTCPRCHKMPTSGHNTPLRNYASLNVGTAGRPRLLASIHLTKTACSQARARGPLRASAMRNAECVPKVCDDFFALEGPWPLLTCCLPAVDWARRVHLSGGGGHSRPRTAVTCEA
ncbi:hypothetical protein B0H67DRAFT_567646 [Lasiosphaeris hirsuta]|uniref:Uncharacterized protein n=1 Tax=Lasiosphaeris hirsuta TaxID=260670 RepID=A0AA40AYH1_9PEZI|nr:hypothetical protein B0H67DRAFT_567646 [Lasiosphaeris hirsuta]